MVDIVLIVLVIALILAVILRQIKTIGYILLPSIVDGKVQLNGLFNILVGIFFGIPVIGQIYVTVIAIEPLSILIGFGVVFTSVFGASSVIEYAATQSPLVETEK